jgi:Ferritin-like
MSSQPTRRPEDLPTDTAALRALIQSAVDVELFTIPLYMTALYSLQGTYAAPSPGPNLWPGLRPFATVTTYNQLAYDVIFSVYVQEMLHLQLAGNLASALGVAPKMSAPTYDGTTVPCIGDLKKMPGYEDVRVELGPVDRNQVRLFLAIENPDWESPTPRPAVPFAGWKAGDPLPVFGTIGHLYECIQEYFDLTYPGAGGAVTLWEKVYDAQSIQIDLFNFTSAAEYHPDEEYPTFDVFFPLGAPAAKAREIADTMIAAITEQGEGRDADVGTLPVDDKYVPSEEGMKVDYNADDAEVRHLWDQLGHFERFQHVQMWLPEIVTWPQWWQARGAAGWTWQDLVTDPDHVDAATKQFAEQRAAALNDPATADQINDALNQSYSSLLLAIEASWTNPLWRNRQGTDIDADDLFPYAAMQALYTRVAAVWAAHGVPQWKKVDTTGGLPYPGRPPHACQGLAPDTPGQNSCANAIIHTCAGANSCSQQGGCGYPSPPSSFPSVNTAQGNGGCGAPIPVAQVFNAKDPSTQWTYEGITFKAGDSVWETAWKIFAVKYPDAKPPATATNLRLVLPPS